MFWCRRDPSVKAPRGRPGERQEAGSAAAAWGSHGRVMDGLWHGDPGPAPMPEQQDMRGHGRRTGRRGQASARLPPLPSSLTSSSLFSSCCSEQAAESEQQEQEILYLESKIRVLFLLSKSNLFCFAGDFTAVGVGGRAVCSSSIGLAGCLLSSHRHDRVSCKYYYAGFTN